YPQNAPFQETPQPSSPQTPISDQRRALMQASLGSSSSQDDSGGLPLNVMNGGQQISPEQIQQLISAYGKSGMQSAGGQPHLAQLAASFGNSNASARLNQLPPQSQEDAYASQQQPTVPPQQARLQTHATSPRPMQH